MKRSSLAFVAAIALAAVAAAAPPAADKSPETVLVRYHVKPGDAEAFSKALQSHFPACRRHGLVLNSPHMILSGKEDGGKPFMVEILTWKDGDAPDSVPDHVPEVAAIWDQLNSMTEARGGHPKIEIEPVDQVATKK